MYCVRDCVTENSFCDLYIHVSKYARRYVSPWRRKKHRRSMHSSTMRRPHVRGLSCCLQYIRKAAHTHVPLSASSIIWYRPMGGDALRLGR